jgi:cation:H+ antiporter
MDLLTGILFIAGFALLAFGAEFLVCGASRLARAVGISPLVVGLTVVAYGTSTPELAVSVQSSFAGVADIALGNVVGSNIANILLILGLSAAVAPLIIARQLMRLDVPLMIGLSILVLLMGIDGALDRFDGLILTIGALFYTAFAIYQSRKETGTTTPKYEQEFGEKMRIGPKQIALQIGFIIGGLALLMLGANWLVDGAVIIARLFKVSDLVIGLTIVAVGTSLPELAASVTAGIRGERDIAVGNIIGSNIFNILLILGLSSAVAPAGLTVSTSALRFDIPVMIAVAVACLPIFFTGRLITRWEGLLFLGYYLAYALYLYLNATNHASLDAFNIVMIIFVVPLTVLGLSFSALRAIRINREKAPADLREQP